MKDVAPPEYRGFPAPLDGLLHFRTGSEDEPLSLGFARRGNADTPLREDVRR